MSDDIDALIGGHGSQLQPAPRRPETPQDEIDRILKQVAGGQGSFVDGGELKRPVTQNFLALVFDMDPATVKKRLLRVKPVGFGGGSKQPRALYDFKEACSYLVEPKIDLDAYIKSLDPNKLPNHINKMFWEAQRTRLRFFIDTGQAWGNEDVLDVLGGLFMLIKDRTLMIPEELREAGVSDEVCETVRTMCDKFERDLHKQLIELPRQRQTQHIFADDPALKSDESGEDD
jgi:hypothetical protein